MCELVEFRAAVAPQSQAVLGQRHKIIQLRAEGMDW
jgi:hypothetical protein